MLLEASCCGLPGPIPSSLVPPAESSALLARRIEGESGILGLAELLAARPNLFSSAEVCLPRSVLAAMLAQIDAIEAAARDPEFAALALGRANQIESQSQTATAGAILGYDFHLTDTGPRLIEINTNAGGAFLVQAAWGSASAARALANMFKEEWRLAGQQAPLSTVAIVDDDPSAQYLFPDMQLAQALLQDAGIDAVVLPAGELRMVAGRLMAGAMSVDLVYNRLTDFTLAEPLIAALREALDADAAVITPAPRHHALFADKRNLRLLSDRTAYPATGLSEEARRVLAIIPKSFEVSPENSEKSWAERRKLFFKPVSGFGSRGVYRGDKLTRRVWSEILEGGYVAQELITPPVHSVMTDEGPVPLKYDLRVFTYAGQPIHLVARLYNGQTTNFRTPFGGFARVHVAPGCC